MNAREFLENETQFHLGFLPTEQSSELTRTLENDFKRNSIDGVATLQRVDRNVLAMAEKIFESGEFSALKSAMQQTLLNGNRIVFSGCGATGRLAILLESMWRTAAHFEYTDRVYSIMTGGDFALVKSVEFFEDYAVFGRRQVQELALGPGDMLVAITEGGETSSVLGTVAEMLDRGGQVFLMFNNPADLLCKHLERSRIAIEDPRVTVLDLSCGPMALAGSTRMQATTSEMLIAGAALEGAYCKLAGKETPDYLTQFRDMLALLEADSTRKAMAEYIDFEADIYACGGKVTYLAHDFLLDVFTDTTERSPTFMLPPFRAWDDTVSAQSRAFVKDPLYSTPDAWRVAMNRDLRCLNWVMPDYEAMGVADRISTPPAISPTDLLKFRIGNEYAPERFENKEDTAVLVVYGAEAENADFLSACAKITGDFQKVRILAVASERGDFAMPELRKVPAAPLRLMEHLAIKLVLNTISTGTMTRAGRVSGNWMSYVALSNKKLIDRGIRLLAELAQMPYPEACERIFEAMAEAERLQKPGEERISAVQLALAQAKAEQK